MLLVDGKLISRVNKTHLLMSFSSIRIIAGNIFLSPKINRYNDFLWLLGVSSPSIIIFTFNMLLLDRKSFF